MAKLQGNFKENGNVDFCPLCGTHRDFQELSFQCPEILKKVEITEIYETIFGSKISLRLRNDEQKKKSQVSQCETQQCTNFQMGAVSIVTVIIIVCRLQLDEYI